MPDISGKVLVATDQHLGYEHSNAGDFSDFLDSLLKRSDFGTFVMLGDFVDMWRRDVSGLFLESNGIVKKLLDLTSTRSVYFIVGNHDYHLRKLLDHDYPFEFLESLHPLDAGTIRYRFVHGWEFDHAQHPAVMDLLCYNLSDEAGQDRSEMWTRLHGLEGELKDLFDFHGGPEGYISHLLQTPEVRLPQFLTDVERSAYSSVNEGEILVFGHTHRPFVSKDNKLVNAGSWVSDAPVHNTFVELDGGQIRLFVFDSKGATEITERISFAATANPSP